MALDNDLSVRHAISSIGTLTDNSLFHFLTVFSILRNDNLHWVKYKNDNNIFKNRLIAIRRKNSIVPSFS